MADIITKPKQRTDYVVRAGTVVVYRGNNTSAAKLVAKTHGQRASTTFRTKSAFDAFVNHS